MSLGLGISGFPEHHQKLIRERGLQPCPTYPRTRRDRPPASTSCLRAARRDFLPWRFSAAGRRSAWRDHHSGGRKPAQHLHNSGSERPFNHQTNSLLPTGIARSPISHIFIPGDMPFISFLLVASPCAPTPSTSRETCTLPAFSNSKVIGSLSPFFSGLFKSIIIK